MAIRSASGVPQVDWGESGYLRVMTTAPFEPGADPAVAPMHPDDPDTPDPVAPGRPSEPDTEPKPTES
jgi:hypothetical protein